MPTILVLSLGGSILALLLLSLRYLLLKRLPSTVYYYAWLLVLMRFALPLPGLLPSVFLTESEVPVETPAVIRTETRTVQPVRSSVPADVPVEEALPAAPASVASSPAVQPNTTARTSFSPAGISWESPRLWSGIWIGGCVLCFGITLLSYLRFTRKLRRSLFAPDPFTGELYSSFPGRKPTLACSKVLRTPLMFGLFSPVIVLPDREYNEELLNHILRHELTHYRRFDTLYKWFSVLVLSVHWFNPLAWFIRRELNRACELSCDEMLLHTMNPQEKRSYGNTLLNMAASGALPAGLVATTFTTEKKNLKERLEQIMTYQKKSLSRVLAAVLALVFLVGCGAAAGPSQTEAESAAESGTSIADDGRPVVRAGTVDEFLAAIAPDTIIELEAGTFSLTSAANYGSSSSGSRYYSWEEAYDGYSLAIQNVSNLSLRGAGKGETVISTDPRYADVINFRDSSGISLSDLTAGHTQEPGFCAGGVLYFNTCNDISVNACGLYGCGTIGVWAENCARLTVTDSDIYECSYSAVYANRCRDVWVSACDVYSHGTREGLGSAISLFEASYSDRFIIYRNCIHDNDAQNLLKLDSTKGALFLSNEVSHNRFDSFFGFIQYSATVDGCVFSDNSCHDWYSGGEGGIYASDAEGNLLSPDALNSMTYREIDPESVAPAKSPVAPTEVSAGGEIAVSTVDDFLAAIGPDRTIVLDGELFDLSEASSYGSLGGEYWYWQESYDGPELVIQNVSSLTIRAAADDPKATTLAAIPRYANVLNFRSCDNIWLIGFTAGHTKEPGSCAGGVLYFDACNGIRVDDCRLYGCGILGVRSSNCSSFSATGTEIYECSQGAVSMYTTDGISFTNCNIHDVPSPALTFTECGDKTWNGNAVIGLSGIYDVTADGRLTRYTYDYYGYEDYSNSDSENPFAYEDPVAFGDNPAALTFAETVQSLIADGDWAALSERLIYPLVIFGDADNYSIDSRELFLNFGIDSLLTPQVRQRIADSSLSEYGHSLFGNTFCDGLLAFVCIGDQTNADDYRLSCISTTTPLS